MARFCFRSVSLAASLLAGLSLSACGSEADPFSTSLHLSPDLPWYGNNRPHLDAMIDSQGYGSPSFDRQAPPVAVLDWDNTIIKNDLGDATLFYMLRTGLVLQPQGRNWRLTSPYLTVDAALALSAACDAVAEPGQPLPTHLPSGLACATEIITVYYDGKTTTGKMAFAGWNFRRMEPTYAWAGQLLAGYSSDAARDLATRALDEGLSAEQDTKHPIGSGRSFNGWLRIYPQLADLIAVLQKRGFDVWIVSASPQQVVEAGASRVGVARDHVIGIRQVQSGGKLTSNIQGCGDIPDGTNDGQGSFQGNSLITYIDGKRCWVNKVIFGDSSAAALQKRPDSTRRQVFAAGDSDTDISFVQDATALKLVINRNKKELMCNAYANAGGRWLVNPMFIEPLAQRGSAYPCSTTACADATGVAGACKDENGAAISDQTDTVFVAPTSP